MLSVNSKETRSTRAKARAPAARPLLAALALASFLLVFHNYGLNLLPERRVPVPVGSIRPLTNRKSFAYVFDYDGSEPDRWPSPRSRVRFLENGKAYRVKDPNLEEIRLAGGDLYAHEPGRIVFSTPDNSDPRSNGRTYELRVPIWYSSEVGGIAALVFLASVCMLRRLGRAAGRPATPPPAAISRWRWHLLGATALFGLGLYLNTGTMAPYAITFSPRVNTVTGYAYNEDHAHFRVLFDFVDGRDRSVWDHALLLRRILYPVLAWPFMRTLGFEIGGTVASLVFNISAFAIGLVLIRRRIGERGAVFAAWILAVSPGAMYWGGLPYPYALIFPLSLLLFLALIGLEGSTGWRLAALSLAMGTAYLAYDLAVLFVPAAMLVLCLRRRFAAAIASVALQLAPTAAWTWSLVHVFRQPLQNANSGLYWSLWQVYVHPGSYVDWWHEIARSPSVALDVFFGANFLFLPALFLVAVALNPLTSRIRIQAAESSLLLSGLALFLFLNMAPKFQATWLMRGTWIARLYQPVYPALVFFAARWWQDMPALRPAARAFIGLAVACVMLGNGLIVFGPILNNPLRLSEFAYYRFYDHTASHWIYEATLRNLGRRPLGFPHPQPPPLTPQQYLAQLQSQLVAVRYGIDANRAVLAGNRKAILETTEALASTRAALQAAGRQIRRTQGGKGSDPPPAPMPQIISSAGSSSGAAETDAVPSTAEAAQAALGKAIPELSAVEAEVSGAQTELGRLQMALTQARAELTAAQAPKPKPH